ncbi:hypothetical protein ACIBU0_22875 [Streptomyces sp. NPDC049627]|uniref:hypothetical protein n=1 Tax=Streptomyces sp. NPDC049627 TaxID=3365595 RepID=UPI003799786E
MKLGKALATGVAEERPQTHAEELELAEELVEEISEPGAVEAPASEEVPAAR